ncbi:uncharacterized protein EV420DRAFT_1555969 [Desarmillaria tabescens]|uniref:F-box domain-containing protein n=1 Tax=Armillaria tabescens TaxID=1929756 RepID=A0AA39K4L7_ARMTA|nr:uncharacterized protein EV420DRAFT_1555969 [Desarmillaria tabescens]KAK0454253.1 hypothetical protein EV420DRAFT_1555969 [Desarmillaria tabescens]
MSIVLPEELVEIIIDMIRYDIMYPWRAKLIACSLVSKSWTRRTRYYLFREITIASFDVPQFMRLLSEPALCTFAPFPKKVFIDHSSMNRSPPARVDWLIHEVLPAISLFPMIEKLYIVFGSGFLLIKSEKKWNALLKSLSKLTRLVDLKLVQCQFVTYDHLAGLVSTFTALETLTLEECEVSKIGPKLRSMIILPSSLHTLNFYAGSGKPSSPFLRLCNYSISLSFLYVTRHKPLRNDSLVLAKLLRVAGASLKRVNIRLPDRLCGEWHPVVLLISKPSKT